MGKIAGLDVPSKQCTFVVQNDEGQTLESGSMSVFVSRQLMANAVVPVIIDAAEVRNKARSRR